MPGRSPTIRIANWSIIKPNIQLKHRSSRQLTAITAPSFAAKMNNICQASWEPWQRLLVGNLITSSSSEK
jgi:hypothetical protein